MMLNISGGMVGGDRLDTTIELGPNAHAVLTTASAAKAYRTEGAVASQHTKITVGAHATLEYLPDHLIPHAGAAVEQKLRIEMTKGSRAIVYDAMAAGRVGRSERWQFRELTSEVAITHDGRPKYMNQCKYLGTMVVVADEPHNWNRLAVVLDQQLQGIEGVQGSASPIAHGGCVARFITVSADSLNRSALKIWAIARRELIGMEAFSLRKF
jgi:urease accessory protein